MCMNFLHIFTRAEVPNSGRLVTTTTSKNTFVSRMPNSLVYCKIMCKWSNRSGSNFFCFPKLDSSIKRSRKNCAFIYVRPFNRKYFTFMTFWLYHWNLALALKIPQPYRPITTSRQNLVLICFIKTDIKSRIRCLKLPKDLDAYWINL